MSFNSAQLLPQLAQYPSPPRFWVAYSGGVDSHVLLHALLQLRSIGALSTELAAVHVNHQLQPQALNWQQHCREVCRAYGVALTEITVDARPRQGESPEAAARNARYHAFGQLLQPGEGLLLGHHRSDQAETLLLQLLRGSGPAGLAAMPRQREFSHGWLGRPLLAVSRPELVAYARERGLSWVDDPSNQNVDYDRNYLRQQVIPGVRERWPAFETTLARAADHQAEALQLGRELAEYHWSRCRGSCDHCLRIDALQQLSSAAQHNLLRYWIRHIHHLPVPGSRQLQRVQRELIGAAADARPLIHWPGGELRRYAGQIHLLVPATARCADALDWDLTSSLSLGDGHRLQTEVLIGEGVKSSLRQRHDVQIRFRQGGERCQPVGRGQHHTLKNLLQEWRVPPWRRNNIPLLYVGTQLAAVVGYCVCEPFQAGPGEAGLLIEEQIQAPIQE